jgi:hypothetical protein
MANFGVQLSLKAGQDMLNIQGDTVEEFLALYEGLRSIVGQAPVLYPELAGYFEGTGEVASVTAIKEAFGATEEPEVVPTPAASGAARGPAGGAKSDGGPIVIKDPKSPATERQIKVIEKEDPAFQLASRVLGRTVYFAQGLTKGEASQVIDAIKAGA